MNNVLVYDPTAKDTLSKVRGVGRYMQILHEAFPDWQFSSHLSSTFDHLPSTFLNPFFNFLSPPLFIKRKFKKQIAVIHDLIPLKYPEHFPIGLKGNISVLLNKIALSNYDVVITDSVQSKRDIIALLHILEKKIKVIYPCLPRIYNSKSIIQILNSKLNSEFSIMNSNYLLYVGDATWNKNLVNLAKAIKMQNLPCVFVGKVFNANSEFRIYNSELKKEQILNSQLNSEFSIMNSKLLSHPWNRELNEFMSLAKNDKRFIFPGFITDEELIRLYQNALCNILVSRDEGFGFSYLEASNQHCSSILSDIPVLREISDNTALFVNPENPQSIANAIKTIKDDQKLQEKFKTTSFDRSHFFSQEMFRSQFLSLLS